MMPTNRWPVQRQNLGNQQLRPILGAVELSNWHSDAMATTAPHVHLAYKRIGDQWQKIRQVLRPPCSPAY